MMKSPSGKSSFFIGLFTAVLLFHAHDASIQAQDNIVSTSTFFVAQPVSDRVLSFSTTAVGVSKPINWGLDLAWLSEANIRRGIAFMGNNNVSVVRASFQPTLPLVNGDLQTAQITDLNTRLNLIDLVGTHTKVALNCDHPSVDASYIGNAVNWAKLMDVSTRRVQERGRKVISVAPFNEPDYGWGQYTGQNGQSDFLKIATELRKNTRFDSIRICGGNTLNVDQALPWYNYLKGMLDEGNTHQLAGSFDNYANFYATVRANGDHATNDELHNVMEAMVAVEYGMQTGIWWGTAELARGEFVKASNGKRLAYAEHRPNWTAASVYKNQDGKIQLFGGTSERQGVTTSYRYVVKDKDVFFDGYGPQREYTLVLPGGTGYQNGQTNAERVVNVSWGEDIQPVINGRYVLVNRNSRKVMEVFNSSTANGASISQRTYKTTGNQHWDVTPVDSRVGGDFSYFTIKAVHSGKVPDVYNFSLDNGGGIYQWDDTKNVNQQWYLEYADDGWFYVRNRNSAKCLEVANNGFLDGSLIQQWDKDGGPNQQWRFIPVGSAIEFIAPGTPAGLQAEGRIASVKLTWTANTEADLNGYNIYRADTSEGEYATIARNVKTNVFVDNTVTPGNTYYYKIRAVDQSMNRSQYASEISIATVAANTLLARYPFDGNAIDSTQNLFHAAGYGSLSYAEGKSGSNALSLNGTTNFLQLPVNIAASREITISTWAYWKGTTAWQRIFDFGNDQSQYMFLTPRTNSSQLRFAIKNGGAEQQLNATTFPLLSWNHIAVSLGENGARMYLNGKLVAESNAITLRPDDIKPVVNYIGRSQFADPLFNGMIDDFRVYNYALSSTEIEKLAGVYSGLDGLSTSDEYLKIWPVPANDKLHLESDVLSESSQVQLQISGINGQIVQNQMRSLDGKSTVDVSGLSPGMYILRLIHPDKTIVKSFMVNQGRM